MSWRRIGQVYVPSGDLWWARTGAQLPTAQVVSDQVLRVYYLSKDGDGFGRIGYVDLNAKAPQQVQYIAPEPVVDLGELGTFDDSGAGPSSVIAAGNDTYLYYQGFQRSHRVPYLTFTGLAIARDGTTRFSKFARTPITDRTDEEPFIRSTCSILRQDQQWKMWYVSTVKWTEDENGLHYICVVRYAESKDGISWQTHPRTCLAPDLEDEYAVGRPSVVLEGGIYKMWYSIRSFRRLYAIGYAESADGISWTRKDNQAGIEKSASGWDSEMICYPNVVDVNGRRLMFYNGNGRGLSGFGCAVWE